MTHLLLPGDLLVGEPSLPDGMPATVVHAKPPSSFGSATSLSKVQAYVMLSSADCGLHRDIDFRDHW